MKVLGYYNGVCGPLEEMTVPMNDRACYFGDGVYEAAMARNGVIFGLDEHMDRLFNSAGLLDIQIPYTKKELADILYDLLGKMDDSEIFIYWQISRGTAMRKHEFPEAGVTANLWITMKPGSCKEPDSSLKLITVEDTRFFHCNIKTLNLLRRGGVPPGRHRHRVRPQQRLHLKGRRVQDPPDRPFHPAGHHQDAPHPGVQEAPDPRGRDPVHLRGAF